MADFNPDRRLESKADHDAYVQWCARELVEVADEGSQGTPRVFATAMLAASWLWVVAQAQLHLDEGITEQREKHQLILASLFTRAREVERAKGDINFGHLLSARVALDCLMPTGRYAASLLEAAKVAVDALQLIFIYPPVDKWDMACPGAWALILCGTVLLEEINQHDEPLTYADYSVAFSPTMVKRIAWDAASRAAQHVGASPPSPN